MREFAADLHIHTCLSPCADLEMSPRAIVQVAIERKLDIVGICDHNSAENVEATRRAAAGTGLSVLAGMEVTSAEEVHVIALYDSTEELLALEEIVYEALQPGENREDVFGLQAVVDENDEVLSINNRLLIGATSLSLRDIVEKVTDMRGLAIASHIDREAFSVIGQLGFIPPELKFDALEVSRRTAIEEARLCYRQHSGLPIITSSDAHKLEDVGARRTMFLLEEPSVREIRMGLQSIGGRAVL